ncbi:UNVERIFIED_CONTAM: 8-hydroxygeraniol dehydrogenase [Sesamum calycinum]|uniref:8-hydroxygeraniol dehydrogenase n=1 Tax=Sesamum calycinum TaxID=2727403 RepID=A0AAW2P957_9LAMI
MAQSVKAFGWAARDSSGVLSPFDFSRRSTADRDVQFKVLYCGICHSDLHGIKNEWGFTNYPMVPGHEIVGVVTEVGSKVQKFRVGDKVGVGCVVNSCRKCDQCANNLENYCPKLIFTYNTVLPDGTVTYGGYSDIMVVDEDFVIRWPENFPMDKGAPLLCAGITTYSPLKYYGLDKPGLHIGVVGLGGLGHVAVKFAKAFGSKVTVISTSVAIVKLVEAAWEVDHGGAPEKPLELPVFSIIMLRKTVAGSMIGGQKETQEMIDFAAKHNILPDVEIISMDYVNTAIERLEKADVKYRFVIDVGKTLKKAETPGVLGNKSKVLITTPGETRSIPWFKVVLDDRISEGLRVGRQRPVWGSLSFRLLRRPTLDRDIQFKVLYCGICHSDLHAVKNHWGFSTYPMLPGHEVVGVVTEVGSKVQKFRVGNKVGVGCLVDSCRKCEQCANNLENYCPQPVFIYNSVLPDGTSTYGGYSDIMVVDEDFVISWPENFPLDKGAPLLCAGITTYSPLRYYGLDKPGLHIGVVGLGGLGHVAVKFIKAFGSKVTAISTSVGKKNEALESLGADAFLVSREAAEMQAAAGTLDGIIDTVSAHHAIDPLLSLLKSQGKLIILGAGEAS